jgi:tetratricopeptide (TPR) repeat protein
MPLSLALSASLLAPVFATSPPMTMTAVAERPVRDPSPELDAEIVQLRELVESEPRERGHRSKLVRALIDAGQLEPALEAAQAWRDVDAYNLVVIRLIGDIQAELGQTHAALRSYSAVVELLPEDPEAQRAVATLLKARGDLDTAAGRLEVAVALRPDDLRLSFELADVALRRGRLDDACAGFEAIVASDEAPEAIRYPAKQRLGQVYAAKRRASTSEAERDALTRKIDALELKGGSENDIKVYLTWDTDRTDVDLWVINPAGEKVFYSHRKGEYGGTLFDDVTNGYGPESFTATAAHKGEYAIEVNYFGNRGAMKEARGEVLIVLDEGRPNERQQVFSYVLQNPGATVRVAEIEVK